MENFRKILEKLMRFAPGYFQYISNNEQYLTPKICEFAVNTKDYFNINHVPQKFRTKKIFEIAVKNSTNEFNSPLQFLTKKMIKRSMCKHHYEWIKNLCITAVQNCGKSIKFVPWRIINDMTPEIYEMSIRSDPHSIGTIIIINKNTVIIDKLILFAIETNGITLGDIPEKFRTQELCEIAVRNNGDALQFVPMSNGLKNSNHWMKWYISLCHIACDNKNFPVKHIPKFVYENYDGLQQTMYIEDVKMHYGALYKRVIRTAVMNNGMELYRLGPNQFNIQDLCKFAVMNNGLALKYVPSFLMNLEIRQFEMNIRTTDSELCKIAVMNNGLALQYVPKELRTINICKIATENNSLATTFIEGFTPPHLNSEIFGKISGIDLTKVKNIHKLTLVPDPKMKHIIVTLSLYDRKNKINYDELNRILSKCNDDTMNSLVIFDKYLHILPLDELLSVVSILLSYKNIVLLFTRLMWNISSFTDILFDNYDSITGYM